MFARECLTKVRKCDTLVLVGKENHMTPRDQNRITRDEHEVVEIYDWALDPEMNEDFAQWGEELAEG
jgi:hypothetical protein